MLTNFKNYSTATVIQTVRYWWENRQIGWWNRIESPQIDPHKYCQLIFDKGANATQWSLDSLFNKWCGSNWTSTCKKMNLDTDLTTLPKINSMWITDLNVKHEVLKLQESNIRGNLDEVMIVAVILWISGASLKLKISCATRDNLKRRQVTDWEKIFVKDTSGIQIKKNS